MATARVKITGIEGYEKKIGLIRSKLGPQLKTFALEGADIIADAAKAKAPHKSGKLKEGIVSKVTWAKGNVAAFAGAGFDRNMNDIFVKYTKTGVRYYYPVAVEYGHKGGAPPHPFMRPAFDENKSKVRSHIKKKLKAAIEGAV